MIFVYSMNQEMDFQALSMNIMLLDVTAPLCILISCCH